MLWFAWCYATAALGLADAFGFSSISKNQQGTTSSRLYEISQSAAVVDSVVECIDELFPPQGLDERIALSRKDGYWPFIAAGEDPPQELVYGEFDVSFLEQSLERARELVDKDDEDIVFCDLGSGTGRLVLAAAALHPNWKSCRGIELLETIHQEAVEKLQSCRRRPPVVEDRLESNHENDGEGTPNDPKTVVLDSDSQSSVAESKSNTGTEFSLASKNGELPLAPIELESGSFTDPYSSFFDADIIFCFSSCLPSNIRINLARSIGRQCLPGTIVLTTEYKLPSGGELEPLPDDPDYPSGEYEIELVDTLSGSCTAVGGESTVYVQRVVKSVGTGTRRVQPPVPVSELAYRAIQYMEENDSTVFLRQVSNQMAFLGFPESWRPKI
jgi:hypothetical protein